jgi:hypothetical protein
MDQSMKVAIESQNREPTSGVRMVDTVAPRDRSLASKIFIGDQGLRAGWSVLLFLVLVVGLCFGSLTLVRLIAHIHRSQTAIAPFPDLLRETALLGGLFLATLIMARIERRSVFSYGFQDDRKLTRLVSGTIVGFLVVSGLVGLLWITWALAFDGRAIHGLPAGSAWRSIRRKNRLGRTWRRGLPHRHPLVARRRTANPRPV